MAKKKDEVTQESELKDLAIDRVKALKGLTRKDRDKMATINQQFHIDRKEILDRYEGDANKAAQKKAESEAADKKKAADNADKKAADKQDKKNK